VVLAQPAVVAAPDLRTDADAVADLDAFHRGPDALRDADDLVPDDGGRRERAPAARDRVHVRAAHAAVGDRDLNVGLLPLLRRVLDHLELVPLLPVCARGRQRPAPVESARARDAPVMA
jgi:hypothetical protein